MANSETGDRKTSLRENLVFYSTAFFCLVAIFSLFIFLFLVPFFIEPALATIYMEFHPEPTICQTTEANQFKGLSKCQWSSCREGCTKEVYECWHIRVRYLSPVPVGQADSRAVRDRIAQDKLSSSTSLSTLRPVNYKNINLSSVKGPQPSNAIAVPSEDKERTTTSSVNENRIQSVLPDDDDENGKEDESEKYTLADEGGNGLHVHEARLQPNVKGCGYPPDVECNATFIPTYGVVGANFSCYYSLIDPTLAITQLNIEKVRAELIYCLTIPIILFVISVVYLFYAYCKLFPEISPANTMQLGKSSQDFQGKKGEENHEGVVTNQPINSPSQMSTKYGQLFQCPSPNNSLKTASRIVRRSKSGGAVTFSSNQKSSQEQSSNFISYENRSINLTGGTAINRGMRTSKSMGDSRKVRIASPLTSPIIIVQPSATASATRSTEKDWRTSIGFQGDSIGNRSCSFHQHNSPSPSEEESTLPV